MKIIDLLNKIANVQEVPEEIVFKGELYSFCNGNYTYCDENNCDRWLFDDLYNTIDILNHEVELIEDETIDIESIEELETYSDDGVEFYDKSDIHKIAKKTNEILQAVKQLNKEIKSIKEK